MDTDTHPLAPRTGYAAYRLVILGLTQRRVSNKHVPGDRGGPLDLPIVEADLDEKGPVADLPGVVQWAASYASATFDGCHTKPGPSHFDVDGCDDETTSRRLYKWVGDIVAALASGTRIPEPQEHGLPRLEW